MAVESINVLGNGGAVDAKAGGALARLHALGGTRLVQLAPVGSGDVRLESLVQAVIATSRKLRGSRGGPQ